MLGRSKKAFIMPKRTSLEFPGGIGTVWDSASK
jgi:hypothetical protein